MNDQYINRANSSQNNDAMAGEINQGEAGAEQWSLTIPSAHRTPYPPPPSGVVEAVCTNIDDLGIVDSPYGRRHELKFVWTLDAARKQDGTPFKVAKWYTASLYDKSNLRKDLAGWRGRDLTADEEKQDFDTKSLIGMPCRLELIHKPGANGKIYARVVRVLPAKGSSVKKEAVQ